MPERLFGDIPGVRPGDWFPSRAALAASGVHPPVQAGISGDKELGANSIVLSGGYEDDEDLGDVIFRFPRVTPSPRLVSVWKICSKLCPSATVGSVLLHR